MSSNIGTSSSADATTTVSAKALVDAIKRTAAGRKKLTDELKEKVVALLNHPKLHDQSYPANIQCFRDYNGA